MKIANVTSTKDAKIVREIVDASESIRRKYNNLQTDLKRESANLERVYKPILDPLHVIADNVARQHQYQQQQQQQLMDAENVRTNKATIPDDIMALDEIPIDSPSRQYFEDIVLNRRSKDYDSTYGIRLVSRSGGTTTTAADSRRNASDTAAAKTKIFMIGDSPVSVTTAGGGDDDGGGDGDDDGGGGTAKTDILTVKGRDYVLTDGLRQLLFLTKPTDYTSQDLQSYRSIINSTNASRVGYKPSGKIKGTKLYKYSNIIRKLVVRSSSSSASKIPMPFRSTASSSAVASLTAPAGPATVIRRSSLRRGGPAAAAAAPAAAATTSRTGMMVGERRITGTGMKQTKKKKQRTKKKNGSLMRVLGRNALVDYVHWDDPNELVERLYLLRSSQAAGNTASHHNEILSLEEELREANIIH